MSGSLIRDGLGSSPRSRINTGGDFGIAHGVIPALPGTLCVRPSLQDHSFAVPTHRSAYRHIINRWGWLPFRLLRPFSAFVGPQPANSLKLIEAPRLGRLETKEIPWGSIHAFKRRDKEG